MSDIANKLKLIQESIPEKVTLVAVSKTKPIEDLQEAYDAGQRDFGENKVQEILAKSEALPKDIRWHMIGHLQRNKVASIIDITHLIHGVDSIRLLKEINKRAEQKNLVADCLIQVHIAEEETKFGFDENEVLTLLNKDFPTNYPNVRIKGLMGMATFTNNQDQVKSEFESLKQIFKKVQSNEFSSDFDTLSMGMSGDYGLAIDAGSTMIRVGSKIFGSR